VPTHFTFEAIGTTWKIDIGTDMSSMDRDTLLKEIIARIDIFDKAYSRFRKDSLVTKMSQEPGDYLLPDDAEPMMSLYQRLYKISVGLMSPLVGRVLSDAGYDATYSLEPKENIAPAPTWEESMNYHHPILTIKKPSLLDLGAIGKGYLIDIVSGIIESRGMRDYVIDAGGDIRYRNMNGKALKVGLENPEDAKQVVGIAEIKNASVCGSSGNRRRWKNYHHIMDPKTTKSPNHILALWTTAKNTMLADALSTTLFFVEPEILMKEYQFEYAIMYADRSVKISPSFPGHFFSQENLVKLTH
jgi:thiamine biosynthesis lipoprotein